MDENALMWAWDSTNEEWIPVQVTEDGELVLVAG